LIVPTGLTVLNIKDTWLVWRFNRGDYEAVRLIYEEHKSELVAIAAALLRDSAAAEDVVHDVFVSFLRLDHFRLTGSLRGYLATCVVNAARNILRSGRRHPSEPLADGPEWTSGGRWPDGEAMFGEDQRLLARAIGELPTEQREVVLLHIHGGLKFAEIAQSQNVSINTVQGRYRYGLEKLRSKLNGEVSHAT
jgi:RNA polymerase sigma-70 factor (ECF subfamily)